MTIKSVNSIQDLNMLPVEIGRQRILVVNLPGIPDWKLISPAILLAARNIEFQRTDRVILFGCDHGELAAYLVIQLDEGHCSIIEYNYTSQKAARLTFEQNQIPLSSVNFLVEPELPSDQCQTFNIAIIHLPKGRVLGRRWLLQAYEALLPGGRLYLVGANASGIQSVMKDAQELFGNTSILAYKKGNRIARLTRPTMQDVLPAWAHQPGIAFHTWVEFTICNKGQELIFHSLPGVFSYDQLDEGTSMLLDAVEITPGADIMDMGCGYGVIGLFAASRGAGRVDLVDSNLLAIAASRESCRLNQIKNVDIYPCDLLNDPIVDKYTMILSNPPFHSGHKVDYLAAQMMIRRSFEALLPGGKLIIVANRFIRYDRLIEEVYGNVSILIESGKYHVLSGLKST